MFKPYQYKKKEYKENPITKLLSSKNALPKPANMSGFVKISVSMVAVLLGVGLMFTRVIVPVVSAYAFSQSNTPILAPLKPNTIPSLSVPSEEFTFSELDFIAHSDGDKAIFSEEEYINKNRTDYPEQFYLTIPKLEIYDAVVDTESSNFDPKDALGHYKGSCLPDEPCNVFIFGHSTNKWVKNKYEAGDYTAIFTNLDQLDYGDEIQVIYKNKKYKYLTDLIMVRDPSEVDPLAQPYPKGLGVTDGTIELFTCTPSGTVRYRLSVVAKLVSVEDI